MSCSAQVQKARKAGNHTALSNMGRKGAYALAEKKRREKIEDDVFADIKRRERRKRSAAFRRGTQHVLRARNGDPAEEDSPDE